MALVKVNEATEAVLDWMVALAEQQVTKEPLPDIEVDKNGKVWLWITETPFDQQRTHWQPSNNWAQSGSIIERERLHICPDDDQWVVHKDGLVFGYGRTPLVAAMRCYITSKLGPEVEVPDELLPKETKSD